MKNIYESRNFFLDIFVRKKHIPVFVNYLIILPIWQILFLFLFACFGFHELFLFLFIQKLASQTCSYSYLREKLLFADHCYINPVHNCFFINLTCIPFWIHSLSMNQTFALKCNYNWNFPKKNIYLSWNIPLTTCYKKKRNEMAPTLKYH